MTAFTKLQTPEIARKAIGDGSILYNPEEMDETDCLRILDHAYEGAPMFNSKAKKR